MLGLTEILGDKVAQWVNRTTSPWLRTSIDFVIGYARMEVQLLSQDPNTRWLMEYIVRGLSNSIGLAVATYVDSLAFTVTNARLGAAMMGREFAAFIGCKRDLAIVLPLLRFAEWALFGLGVYWQFFRGSSSLWNSAQRFFPGNARMPGVMRLTLGAPLLIETWLGTFVLALRAGLLPS